MFHADGINSVKICQSIPREEKLDSIDKQVCDTHTNFCASYLLCIQPKF